MNFKMENIIISDYLSSYDQNKKTGTCKTCDKDVGWSRQHLSSHKRASCKDKQFFLDHPDLSMCVHYLLIYAMYIYVFILFIPSNIPYVYSLRSIE